LLELPGLFITRKKTKLVKQKKQQNGPVRGYSQDSENGRVVTIGFEANTFKMVLTHSKHPSQTMDA
jgi:hypothetical protein